MTDPETKIPVILDMVFPQSWLNAPAPGDPEGRTNREVQTVVSARYISSVQCLYASVVGVPQTHRVDAATEAGGRDLADDRWPDT